MSKQQKMIEDMLGGFQEESKPETEKQVSDEQQATNEAAADESGQGQDSADKLDSSLKADREGEASAEPEQKAAGSEASEDAGKEQSEGQLEGKEEAPEQKKEEETKSEEKEESKDEVIKRLRSELNKAYDKRPEEEKPETKAEEKKEEEKKEQEILDFLGENDLEGVTKDKDSFNKFLNSFYHKIREQVVRETSKVASATASSQAYYRDKINQFYTDNDDLKPVQRYVGAVAQQVASEKPELELDSLLEETNKRVRQTLGIHKEAQEKETQRQKKKPALPSTSTPGGGAEGADNRTSQQKQIDEILR